MNKPILSFVYFSALALAMPLTSSIAAPNDPANSTAASDRQFLANLENKEAPKALPAQTAPAPNPEPTSAPEAPRFRNETAPAAMRTENPAPIAKTDKTDTTRSKEKPVQAKVAPKKATTDVAKANYRDRNAQPVEVAASEGTPVAPVKKTTTTVTVVQPLNDDRDGDHDGDHDHDNDNGEHHHRFFHRLFAHVFNPQHSEDQ